MRTPTTAPEPLIPAPQDPARRSPVDTKAAIILVLIAVLEGSWLFLNLSAQPIRFLRFSGLVGSSPSPWALISAVLVAALFVWYSAHLPSVRAHLFRWSRLKFLAVTMAIASGFCEEIIFRKVLMDSLQHARFGVLLQVAASALAFGGVHAIWGLFRGSFGAATGAALITGALGLALALVYVAAGRNVAPCIIAHFLINCFAEPGLILASIRGEMNRTATQ